MGVMRSLLGCTLTFAPRHPSFVNRTAEDFTILRKSYFSPISSSHVKVQRSRSDLGLHLLVLESTYQYFNEEVSGSRVIDKLENLFNSDGFTSF